MGDFENIPEIKIRIDRSKMKVTEDGFYVSPEWDSQSCSDQDFVNNFKKGWDYRQSKIDELQNQLKSIVSEFDLWGGASDQVERQIEIIRGLIQ